MLQTGPMSAFAAGLYCILKQAHGAGRSTLLVSSAPRLRIHTRQEELCCLDMRCDQQLHPCLCPRLPAQCWRLTGRMVQAPQAQAGSPDLFNGLATGPPAPQQAMADPLGDPFAASAPAGGAAPASSSTAGDLMGGFGAPPASVNGLGGLAHAAVQPAAGASGQDLLGGASTSGDHMCMPVA